MPLKLRVETARCATPIALKPRRREKGRARIVKLKARAGLSSYCARFLFFVKIENIRGEIKMNCGIGKTIKAGLLSAAFLSAAGAAYAQDSGNFYVGVRAGVALSAQDDSELTAGLQAAGHNVSAQVDSKDTGYGIYGGYRFQPNAAIEVGLISFGEFGARVSGTTSNSAKLQSDISVQKQAAGYGVPVVIRAWFPMSANISATQRIGGFYWRDENNVGSSSASKDGFGLTAGLGFMAALSQKFQMGLAWDLYRPDSSNVLQHYSLQIEYILER